MQTYFANRVAFVGKFGVGKSFTANWLSQNYNFKIFSFATGLKEIARDYYDMKDKDRLLLQNIGDAMRSVDKDVFARKTIRDVEKYEAQCESQDEKSFVVIDDLRFENEYRALKNIYGSEFIVIRIKTTMKSQPPQKGENHYSEQQASEICADYELNSGDFDGLTLILSD